MNDIAQHNIIQIPEEVDFNSIDNIFLAASDLALFIDSNGVIQKASAQQP